MKTFIFPLLAVLAATTANATTTVNASSTKLTIYGAWL